MVTRRATLAALVATAFGCVTRSLPIPPPSATIQSIAECPLIDCPMGGVSLTVGGSDALAGATVTVLDEEAPIGPSELLGAAARADGAGVWQVVLVPRRVSAGAVVAVQRGHRIRVFQVTDDGEASQSFFLVVPRM